ncbi:hypothetical protein HGM15179_018837 [Zosterops borbonicus]|uniref:ribonuclease H n=1 Tax=Zosterops borbonicus TaxID=364589 RepID=A0A8K1FYS5_9PASS|nr:hypothetical protein HGM15179_018837 [Zosterops borbonicus]
MNMQRCIAKPDVYVTFQRLQENATTEAKEEISEEILNQVCPGVWASSVPGRARNAFPIQIKFKEGKQPVRIKQNPLKEDREGISPISEDFQQLGLLRESQSDFNTPILPVSKPYGSYQVMQDLRAVNKITEDLYPVVANLVNTLLMCLTLELTWFTPLDLKDAFFCLPLCEATQKNFTFEWENPKSGCKAQLTWTVLPQGYKNSPTLFGEQLAKDLESWEAPSEGKLLQYVDDILIATLTEEWCMGWTGSLLNLLGLQGYRVTKKRAQVVKQKVIYLGHEISAGQWTLGKEHMESICKTPKPQTIKELRTFLGMMGLIKMKIRNVKDLKS